MKRFITLLCCLLLASSTLSAQSHLEFKGITIDGTTKSDTAQLETVGFSTYKVDNGYETTAICAERYIWKTFYTANNSDETTYGNILLEVSNIDTRGGIALSYEDATNSKLYTSEKNLTVAKDL